VPGRSISQDDSLGQGKRAFKRLLACTARSPDLLIYGGAAGAGRWFASGPKTICSRQPSARILPAPKELGPFSPYCAARPEEKIL
jgi:hypothetical protein